MKREYRSDAVRRRSTKKRPGVLQGAGDLVAPTLSPEEEDGLVEAIDQAHSGGLVEGAAAFSNLRRRVRAAR